MADQRDDSVSVSSEPRRFFLKKSVLALAGIGFSSSLLAGCGGDNPFIEPGPVPKVGSGNPGLDSSSGRGALRQLNNADTDIVNMIRGSLLQLISAGTLMGPGAAVSMLFGILWPSDSVSNWPKIINEINTIVSAKIEQATITRLSNTLESMRVILSDYIYNSQLVSGESLQTLWLGVMGQMDGIVEQFLPNGDLSVTPLYAQAALLCTLFYRDGLTNNAVAWDADHLKKVQLEVSERIAEHLKVLDDYHDQLMGTANATTEGTSGQRKLRAVNNAREDYYLAVGDFRDLIDIIDPVKHPLSYDATLPRVLYLEPWGHTSKSHPATIDYDKRTAGMRPPISFTLYSTDPPVNGDDTWWFGSLGSVSGIKIDWDGNTGPYQQSTQMFGRSESDPSFTVDNVGNDANAPITQVCVYGGHDTWENDALYSLGLAGRGGQVLSVAGGINQHNMPNYAYQIANHVFVDVVPFREGSYGPACLCFGFQLMNLGKNVSPTMLAPLLYRTSITAPSTDELVQRLQAYMPPEQIKAALLQRGEADSLSDYIAANISGWQADRMQFWQMVERSASQSPHLS